MLNNENERRMMKKRGDGKKKTYYKNLKNIDY
jgi:hypothetical protein